MRVAEFIERARAYTTLGNWHYLYGYKGETITEGRNTQFASLYPKIWGQSNYKKKSKQWIGDKATDCSGLVSLASSCAIVGSYQMGNNWERIERPRVGAIAWREGHVAIVSQVEGDRLKIIEAAGIESGIRERTATVGEFKRYVLCPTVEYETQRRFLVGWNKDRRGWLYSPNGEDLLHSGAYKCPWSKQPAGSWFYFDAEGYCIITDENGCLKEPRLEEKER